MVDNITLVLYVILGLIGLAFLGLVFYIFWKIFISSDSPLAEVSKLFGDFAMLLDQMIGTCCKQADCEKITEKNACDSSCGCAYDTDKKECSKTTKNKTGSGGVFSFRCSFFIVGLAVLGAFVLKGLFTLITGWRRSGPYRETAENVAVEEGKPIDVYLNEVLDQYEIADTAIENSNLSEPEKAYARDLLRVRIPEQVNDRLSENNRELKEATKQKLEIETNKIKYDSELEPSEQKNAEEFLDEHFEGE